MEVQVAPAQTTEISFSANLKIELKIANTVIATLNTAVAAIIGCKPSSTVQKVSGDVTDMTMTLNGAAQTFQWVLKYTDSCHSLMPISYEEIVDPDGLITSTPTSTTITVGLTTYRQITVDFSISDAADASKARTRVINFGVKFAHTSTTDTWQ